MVSILAMKKVSVHSYVLYDHELRNIGCSMGRADIVFGRRKTTLEQGSRDTTRKQTRSIESGVAFCLNWKRPLPRRKFAVPFEIAWWPGSRDTNVNSMHVSIAGFDIRQKGLNDSSQSFQRIVVI